MDYRNMQENTPHTPRRGNDTTTTTVSTSTPTPTSTTTTVELCHKLSDAAEAALRRIAFENLKESYHGVMGRPMPPSIAKALLLDLEAGTPGIYYSYAMSETALAPAPSWRYVQAIIRRLQREHVNPDDLLGW